MLPPSLKTGFSQLVEKTEDPTHDINVIFTHFTKQVIDIACKYVKEAGRTCLTKEDVIYAMKYQAHEYEIPETIDSESEEDSSGSEEESEDSSGSEEMEFCRSVSDEKLSSKINYYVDTWNSWEPQNNLQKLLYNAINAQSPDE